MVYWGSKRVSYNGYYVSFPRMRREFDSLHPHQMENCPHNVWDFWGFDNGCGIMRVISFSYGWVPETAAVN